MAKHARSDSQADAPGQPSKKAAKGVDHSDHLRHPSTKVAKAVDQNPPMGQLSDLLSKQKSSPSPRNVLHWFRSKDVRIEDNKALHAASQMAQEGKGSLITCYLFSPKDMEWHGTSPARSDFIHESLRIVQDQLRKKNIPLVVLTADERGQKIDKVMDFVRRHDISHVFANLEYEIDELRRDIKLVKKAQQENDVIVNLMHDQTIVAPGLIKAGSGGPMQVFTPYHKAWLAKVKKEPDLLDLSPPPEDNDKSASNQFKDLFNSAIPSVPENKQFASPQEQDRIRKLWPPGHAAGMERLRHFLQHKSARYADHRSEPAQDVASRMSPYLASGVVSAREAVAEAKRANKGRNCDEAGDAGIASWVREIVFREFYRQMLVLKPHEGMNLPNNMKFDNVRWEEDEEGWRKWCEGRTGVPFVDAGMRQLNHEAYMHNRLRMNVSSYLSANLLLDYRRGERYFAEHLIDWDLANNTNGWEPSYTVFNPVAQAEKCDPDGTFIRKWVPELRGVEGKAIFAPHERLGKAEFEKLGYPKPYVDYKETKDRAISRYKEGLASAPAI